MRDITYKTWIARGLARALLADADQAGGTSLAALQARCAATLGDNPPLLRAVVEPLAQWPAVRWQQMDIDSLTQRILLPVGRPAADNTDVLDDTDSDDEPSTYDSPIDQAFATGDPPRIRRLILRPARMRPRPLGLEHCGLPDLPTVADLAQWLDIPLQRLLWLSPTKPLGADHYRYQLLAKRTGGLRLLEVPKADLKKVQRAIHTGLLQHIPVHEAAHGFVAQRSVGTHAAAHAGQAVVIRFDVRDFFGGIGAAQVRALWHTLGYPPDVAQCLTALCTHRTAKMVVDRMRQGDSPVRSGSSISDADSDSSGAGLHWLAAKRLRSPHLPQGAPTSPALANLCAFNLDLRLEGLAWTFGATYTRYGDDLVFSGGPALRRQFRALQAWVTAIANDEGFALHPDKTRCLPQHRQQRITGVVVNAKPQTPREEFDRLKACLHQCVMKGPASQNAAQLADFRGHLLGRIAWVQQFNGTRAKKLHAFFDRIQW